MSDPACSAIPSIKYFGTTWYDRGWRYRWCRFKLALWAIVMAVAFLGGVTAFFAGMLDGVTSWSGRLSIVLVGAIAILWSCYSAFLKLRRSPEDRAVHRPMSFARRDPTNVRAGGAAGIATGTLASGGSGLAGALLVVGSLFLVGQALGYLFITLGRYYNDEEWLLAQEYGLENPGPRPR